MKYPYLFFLLMIAFVASQTEKQVSDSTPTQTQEEPVAAAVTEKPSKPQVSVASPLVLVYKMKKDYSKYVPVILSEDKTTIVSYPHPRDIYTNGQLALPTSLPDDYWLDNRGINENVAFLSFTYEAYAKLSDVPSMEVLYGKIMDNDPLLELWTCGHRQNYQDFVAELKEIISNKELSLKFKRIK